MVEAHWEDVRGEELRFRDQTWEFTGDVDLRGTGEVIRARARRADGVKREGATLQFGLEDAGESLNPGSVGEVFARLEREGGRDYLVVRKDPRTYRYELQSLEYD